MIDVRCRVLVGAPRDNVTDTDAPQSVRQLVRPGVVYQCPISPLSDDCTALHLDREGLSQIDTSLAYDASSSRSIVVAVSGSLHSVLGIQAEFLRTC